MVLAELPPAQCKQNRGAGGGFSRDKASLEHTSEHPGSGHRGCSVISRLQLMRVRSFGICFAATTTVQDSIPSNSISEFHFFIAASSSPRFIDDFCVSVHFEYRAPFIFKLCIVYSTCHNVYSILVFKVTHQVTVPLLHRW